MGAGGVKDVEGAVGDAEEDHGGGDHGELEGGPAGPEQGARGHGAERGRGEG